MANDRLRIAKLAFPCITHGGSFRFSHSAHGGSLYRFCNFSPRVQTPFAVIRNASPRDIAIMTLLNKLVGRHASLYAAFNSIRRVSYVPILDLTRLRIEKGKGRGERRHRFFPNCTSTISSSFHRSCLIEFGIFVL